MCQYVSGHRVSPPDVDPFSDANTYKVRDGKDWYSPTHAIHNIGMYINTLTPTQKRIHQLSFNCYVRKVYVKGEPILRIYALRSLKAGEELFWDYGDEYIVNDRAYEPIVGLGSGQ